MGVDGIELDSTWPGLDSRGARQVSADALIEMAKAIESRLTQLSDSGTSGSPTALSERARITRELGANQYFRCGQAATNTFNHTLDVVVTYYSNLLTQLANAATALRANAAQYQGNDEEAARLFTNMSPEGQAPAGQAPEGTSTPTAGPGWE